MIRARVVHFSPHFPARWAIPVLQELRATVAEATVAVAEIADLLKIGDPATGAIDRLRSLLTTLGQQATAAGDLPEELQTAIAELLGRLGATVAAGDTWLARADQELSAQQVRQRLQRAYGVP